MAARASALTLALSLALLALTGCGPTAGKGAAAPTRIVSLVPAVTEMLFAIGAGPVVVGVSSYDHFPPEVDRLPRVGALLDPDTERILSLRPDLVVVYGSQIDQETRFTAAGIRTFSYRHGGISATLETMSMLGALTGHVTEADAVVRDVTTRLNAVRSRVAGRPRPQTLVVIGRQPGTLQGLYASGGLGLLHELLAIAGGNNVFADVASEAVQPSHETLLVKAPEVIVELDAQALSRPDRERLAWAPLSSIPAVRQGRLLFLSGEYLVVAGPRLAQATEALARALHPEAFK